MTFLTVLALFVLWRAALARRRGLKRSRLNTFRRSLLASFVTFMQMLVLVLVLYDGLFLALKIFPDWISTARLIELEDGLSKLASIAKLLDLSALLTIFVFLILYAIGLWKIVPAFEKYRNVTKRIYQFLTILCCFTLLGTAAGSPAVDLSVRINRNREGYGVLKRNIARAVDKQIASGLLDKISESIPPDYFVDKLDRIDAADKSIRALQDDYGRIRGDGGANAVLAKFLVEHPPADDGGEGASSDGFDLKGEPPGPDDGGDRLSNRQIERAETALAEANDDSSPQTAERELREKVVSELFSGAIEGVKSRFLDALVEEFPILGPVSDVFSDALGEGTKPAINRIVERIALSRIGTKTAMDTAIKRGAASIVQPLTIKADFRSQSAGGQALRKWHAELRQIDDLEKTVPAQAAKLEERAAARAEEQRERAVNRAESIREGGGIQPGEREVGAVGGGSLNDLREGLRKGWVVTRNSADDSERLFVHAREVGGMLEDLRYLVKESQDGSTWTVYLPPYGGGRYGERVGTIPRPESVEVGECGCR